MIFKLNNFPLNKRKTSFIVTFVLCAVLLVIAGCGEDPTESTSKVIDSSQPFYHQVQSEALVKQSSYLVNRKFAGTIVSKQTASLNFEIQGRVDEVLVDEGATVEQGQLLAQLDSELLSIELKQLKAQLMQVSADMDLVKANLTRNNSLLEQGYTSAQRLDELNAQQNVLLANEQQLNASIEAKQYQINHSQIRAPFAGTINKRMINTGEVVSQQIIAFEIQRRGNNELKVGVPKSLIPYVKDQKQYHLSINDQDYIVDNLAINSNINLQSRTVQLRFELADNIEVFNNQIAYFKFQQEHQEQGFWVPLAALTDGIRGTWNIYILKPLEHDPELFEIKSHSIVLLHSEQDKAFIQVDVPTGTQILKSGIQRFVPGQKVRKSKTVINTALAH